jgi:hypothetical protein
MFFYFVRHCLVFLEHMGKVMQSLKENNDTNEFLEFGSLEFKL